jgi:hypothetical protein
VKSKLALVLIIVFILLPGITYLPAVLSSEVTGCVKCHTNEQILKNLYKPPKIDTSEGEG